MPRAQSGFALLVLLLLLVLGGTAFFLGASDPGATSRSREGTVAAERLQTAAEAVVAYAVFEDESEGPPVPGALPCPDYHDPTGPHAGSSSNCNDADLDGPPYLKRFPWREFGTSRDLSGLRYAIDGDFLEDSAGLVPLNPDTETGSLTINESGEYAAVIIEPNAILADENSDGNTAFVDCTGNADCDDRVRGISSDRIFALVRRRVPAAVRQGLDAFFSSSENDGEYPWAAELGDSEGECVAGNTSGSLPLNTAGTCDALGPHLPDWVQDNKWAERLPLYYAVGCDHVPDSPPCDSSDPDRLTLSGEGDHAVVFGDAGPEIESEAKEGEIQRRDAFPNDVRQYLDSEENVDDDGEFDDPRNGEGENDRMFAIPRP